MTAVAANVSWLWRRSGGEGDLLRAHHGNRAAQDGWPTFNLRKPPPPPMIVTLSHFSHLTNGVNVRRLSLWLRSVRAWKRTEVFEGDSRPNNLDRILLLLSVLRFDSFLPSCEQTGRRGLLFAFVPQIRPSIKPV